MYMHNAFVYTINYIYKGLMVNLCATLNSYE